MTRTATPSLAENMSKRQYVLLIVRDLGDEVTPK
jgi:hypothetical protein